MSARHDRIRNLGAAGVLAVVAALLAMLAMPRHSGKAEAASRQQRALVATRDLPVGTDVAAALASHAIAWKPVAAGSLATDAVGSGLAGSGQVVVQPIYAGEQITRHRLGETGAAGLRSVLTGAERILQVPGDANQLLAGTLRDGDHVDVVASIKRGATQTPYAGVVLRNLVVLHAPGAPPTAVTGVAPALSATVELTERQVQQLFFVLKNGDWSFVLRPAAHASGAGLGPDSADSVLEGR